MNSAEIIAVITVTLISLWTIKVIHLKLHLHKIRPAKPNNYNSSQRFFNTNAATNPHQLLHGLQQIPH